MMPSLLRWFRSRSQTMLNRANQRKKTTCKLHLEGLEDRTVPSTIQGTVFNDANSNGLLDVGEAGSNVWRTFLDVNRNSVLDAGETSAVTDAAGTFALDTTNETPAQVGSSGTIRDYLGLVLEPGSGGRWLNTTATFAAINRNTEPDATRNFGVQFQPFVGVAPAGPEILVNGTVAGQQGGFARIQGQPVSVATDAAGNSVVAWRTFVDGGTDTILARKFRADGTPMTGELVVGTATGQSSWHQMPQAAMTGDGRFAVAWSSYDATLQASSTFLRVYLGNGTPVTARVTVVQGTAQTSGRLEGIAMNGNGDFAVMYGRKTYSKSLGWPSNESMMIQRYTQLGAVNGQVINAGTPSLVNGERSLAMDAAGNFVAVWDDAFHSSGKNSTLNFSVYARRYNASGQLNGSLITVASSPDSIRQSSVAMARDGRFAVAWGQGIARNAQLFNADGSRGGVVREVTHSNTAEAPFGIAYDDAGNVTFAFTDVRSPTVGVIYPYDSGEVRFRRLTAFGEFEPETIVNTTTQGAQFRPGIAATGNGTFIVAWQGHGPGDNAGIFAQRYNSAPHMGSFTASPNPATVENPVTLTAADVQALTPGSTITQVAFYVDSNSNGVLDSGDTRLVGSSTYSNGTWTFTFSTTDWTTGTYTLFAQAEDSFGAFSDPLALDLQIM